jgi:hypothetical protein
MSEKYKLQSKVTGIIASLHEDQYEHFSQVIERLAGCYLNNDMHGVFLIADDKAHTQSLIAINADDQQIDEMVNIMSETLKASPLRPS